MRDGSRWVGVLAAALITAVASGWAAPAADAAAAPTPRATCGPGSRPETSIQGRVPKADVDSGRAQQGYTCNTEELSRFGSTGGYKVHRYVDGAGHECAYYDSTLLFPGSAQNTQNLTGIYVLDMANPAKPVKTDNLLTPAMQSPHESLNINARRGLLVADMGYPTFNPGFVDIYDISGDCRRPVLKSSTPLGVLGHESGFSPDGFTFWVASTGGQTLTALDITDPTLPRILWVGRDWTPHGVRVSADGNRLYIADTSDGLHILDISQIQARKANPVVTELSHLQWPNMSIPQVAIPVTIKGKPYLVEVDEFARGVSTAADAAVGAARIIDIADEKRPFVVSEIRLEVNSAEGRAAAAGDPGASSGLQGYAGHYCSVPQEVEPGIVACSFIISGLRIFDIRDPLAPKEIAYFNKPSGNGLGSQPSSYAMSAPAYVPERSEIWYADGNSGFWAVRITNNVWPFKTASVGSGSSDGSGGGAGGTRVAGRRASNGTLAATGASAAVALTGAALLILFLAARRAAHRSK